MHTFNQVNTDSPFTFEVSEEQFAVDNGSFNVPPLELGEAATEYPTDMLRYFRQLWHANGHSPIRSPHHAVITLPPKPDVAGIVLTNSYRGQTDGEIMDRTPYLEEYRQRAAELATMKTADERAAYQRKLARILEHLPDLNGFQGIEQYQLFLIPPDSKLPFRYRINSFGSMFVSQEYRLGPEAERYNLPTRKQGKPYNVYPFGEASGAQLRLDGILLQADKQPEVAKATRQHLRALLPLLRAARKK